MRKGQDVERERGEKERKKNFSGEPKFEVGNPSFFHFSCNSSLEIKLKKK